MVKYAYVPVSLPDGTSSIRRRRKSKKHPGRGRFGLRLRLNKSKHRILSFKRRFMNRVAKKTLGSLKRWKAWIWSYVPSLPTLTAESPADAITTAPSHALLLRIAALESRVAALESSPAAAAPREVLQPSAAASAAPTVDPKFAKYARMRKMGLAEGAVRQALLRDGLSPEEYFNPGAASAAPGERSCAAAPAKKASASMLQGVKLRKRKAAPKRATPAAAKRSGITKADIEGGAKRLRKASARKPRRARAAPAEAAAAGRPISLAAIRSVRLRKTPKVPTGGENGSAMLTRSKKKKAAAAGDGVRFSLGEITNTRLKSTGAKRSPGGTPAKRRRAAPRSPSMARSQGEFLQSALARKFSGVLAPTPQAAAASGLDSSTWSVSESPSF